MFDHKTVIVNVSIPVNDLKYFSYSLTRNSPQEIKHVIILILADLKALMNIIKSKLCILPYTSLHFKIKKKKKRPKNIYLFFRYTTRTFFIIFKIKKFKPFYIHGHKCSIYVCILFA